MTGPELFKRAEALIARAQSQETPFAAITLAEAQVHATLALAAATALGLDAPPAEYDAWQKVCGVKAS